MRLYDRALPARKSVPLQESAKSQQENVIRSTKLKMVLANALTLLAITGALRLNLTSSRRPKGSNPFSSTNLCKKRMARFDPIPTMLFSGIGVSGDRAEGGRPILRVGVVNVKLGIDSRTPSGGRTIIDLCGSLTTEKTGPGEGQERRDQPDQQDAPGSFFVSGTACHLLLFAGRRHHRLWLHHAGQ